MDSNTTKRYDFLLAGVGGQGIVLASHILAEVGLAAGFDVKQSEVHGMSQRGGSVNSHVRWNTEKVCSPLVGLGEADFVVAFERVEALRHIEFLRPGGMAIINDQAILPTAVTSGDDVYPTNEQIEATLARLSGNVRFAPGIQIARQLGNTHVTNVAILGTLSTVLTVPEKTWLAVIEARVPKKHVELNRQAFRLGKEMIGG